MNRFWHICGALTVILSLLSLSGCKDGESYSDLLRDEEKAVNWFLADKRVEMSVPENNDFEIGDDAPFYRMNEDGTVYMQVINMGDMNDRPQKDDKVYFRFMRRNIKVMYEGSTPIEAGNMNDFNNPLGSTYFFYGNTLYPNSTQYGTGIQIPLDYLGYYAEVNLVLKSYSGFTVDQSQCLPYIINVKYYKADN